MSGNGNGRPAHFVVSRTDHFIGGPCEPAPKQEFRDCRRRPPASISGPAIRKLWLTVNQPMAISTGMARNNTNLAVPDPASRPRILADNTDRVDFLLRGPGVIDNKDTAITAKGLHDTIAESALLNSRGIIPGIAADPDVMFRHSREVRIGSPDRVISGCVPTLSGWGVSGRSAA